MYVVIFHLKRWSEILIHDYMQLLILVISTLIKKYHSVIDLVIFVKNGQTEIINTGTLRDQNGEVTINLCKELVILLKNLSCY